MNEAIPHRSKPHFRVESCPENFWDNGEACKNHTIPESNLQVKCQSGWFLEFQGTLPEPQLLVSFPPLPVGKAIKEGNTFITHSPVQAYSRLLLLSAIRCISRTSPGSHNLSTCQFNLLGLRRQVSRRVAPSRLTAGSRRDFFFNHGLNQERGFKGIPARRIADLAAR
jgi:hypothetical protein